MEIYLNIAEWGPNGEFGAEAGARRAFGRPARDLSRYQAALLAADAAQPGRPQRAAARARVAPAGRALCRPAPRGAPRGRRLPAANPLALRRVHPL